MKWRLIVPGNGFGLGRAANLPLGLKSKPLRYEPALCWLVVVYQAKSDSIALDLLICVRRRCHHVFVFVVMGVCVISSLFI